MNFILHFIYVIDQLVLCVSLCVFHMCMITVFVHLCILLCAAENDVSAENYTYRNCSYREEKLKNC